MNKQTKSKDPQQFDFIGKIEDQNNGGTMLFITAKSEETRFEFLQNSVNIYKNRNGKDFKFVKQFWEWIFKICSKRMARYWQWKQRVTIHTKIQSHL